MLRLKIEKNLFDFYVFPKNIENSEWYCGNKIKYKSKEISWLWWIFTFDYSILNSLQKK